ncbi:hypothetical protein ACFL4D_00805 [Candidatus Margulisiibacteriota bacterium]
MNNTRQKNKGFVLLTILVLLLIVGGIGWHTMLIFRSGTIESADSQQSIQALGVAQAGMNWVLEEFEYSADWDSVAASVNGETIALNPGTFEIGIASLTTNLVTVNITANVAVLGNTPVRRTMQLSLSRDGAEVGGAGSGEPQHGGYGLFTPSTETLQLIDMYVSGNVYNGGDVIVDAGSVVTEGVIYVPFGYTVTGDGQYEWEEIDPLPQTVPAAEVADTYTALMSSYNAYFTSNTNLALSGVIDLAAAPYFGELRCRRLTFSGDCTIVGEGIIAASDYIKADSSLLTVNPDSGKQIVLAAQNAIDLNGKNLARTIDMERVVLYSRYDDITIWNDFVTVRDSILLTNDGRLYIYAGGRVLDSEAYLSRTDPSSLVFYLTGGGSYFTGTLFAITGLGRISGQAANRPVFRGLYYGNSTDSKCVWIRRADFEGAIMANYIWDGMALNRARLLTLYDNIDVLSNPPPLGLEAVLPHIIKTLLFRWRGN